MSSSCTPVAKFIHIGGERVLIKGVAYGTFAPDANGYQFPPITQVRKDFRAMRAAGFNTVRTYTVPHDDVLDAAADHGLKLMIGLPWTQHVAFLDDGRLARSIRRQIAVDVRRMSQHPAALLFAVGNEIPPNVIRWHGAAHVEQFLQDVYHETKAAAPDAALTYVNYPPTAFLEIPFFDVCAFNVYLHREKDLAAYIAHLQHLAGNRPLLLAELGADSLREGEEGQAALIAMQIRTALTEGACGAIAYSWTDDWWRGGEQVTDWAFGLTDSVRVPKLALASVAREFAADTPSSRRWPKVSVLVCAYNAASTIGECLESLAALRYPDYEVIVVNDGSRDATSAIAHRFPRVKVVDTANHGLSAARNTAAEHASGEIVAYCDSDVRVDPDWLRYLVQPLLRSNVVGAGGPNIVPPDDPWIAQCVARSPGGPTHVLMDDRIAEHVPGCNMAFWRSALMEVGGFDVTYHVAGDDVDLCWRLQSRGHTLGFSPNAVVWHRHRSRVKAYWRQQVGYGEAETWLMERHPERFLDGHALWRGRIYSALPSIRAMSQMRVNAGIWGTAAFPSVYSTATAAFLPHQIQWLAGVLALGAAGFLAEVFGQYQTGAALGLTAAAGLATTIVRCLVYGWRTDLRGLPAIGGLPTKVSRLVYRLTIAGLHVLQPLARAWGRFKGKLWPPEPQERSVPVSNGRQRTVVMDLAQASLLALGRTRRDSFWSESWLDRTKVLSQLSGYIRTRGIGRTVHVDDGWQQHRDLTIAVGRWAWLDVRTLVEEHAHGRSLLRVAHVVRLTPATSFTLLLGLMAVIVVARLTGGLIVLATAAAGVVAIVQALRQLGRVEAGFRDVMSQICIEFDLLPLGSSEATEPRLGVGALPIPVAQEHPQRAPEPETARLL